MAYHSILSSSISSPSFFPRKQSIFSSRTHKIVHRTVVYCRNSYGDSQSKKDADSESETKFRKVQFNLLKLSATLTVVSASLPQPSFAAKVSEKRRSAKKLDALTLQEYEKWSQGLPAVAHRLPYTEILDLKRENRLKRIIKPANAGLKQRPHVVLVVLEDSMVVRIVLPSVEADPKFWRQWDELKLDEACVNAYIPPLKKPEMPSPYLNVLEKVPSWMFSLVKPEPQSSLVKPKPQSKKVMELKRMKEEFTGKMGEFAKATKEKEESEKAIEKLNKIKERKKRMEMKKIKADESFRKAQMHALSLSRFWTELAYNKAVATSLGFLFFYIFYQTVVLNYRKQNKDYEERLLLEKEDAGGGKELNNLVKEMESVENEVGEGGGGQGEQNTEVKAAMQFMKSGARVRRAQNKKLSQYLEKDVDVKFTDVAGLGKIREELEEIVKFFTHGDMYRRRGIRIPGGILLCGPPGVGKTLLAKAVAGEAGVSFFSISASQFVEIYVGVGAARVRSLYEDAKESAPSVVFIDELDAVGRERGLIEGSGGEERDATLNQLLVCLDGFEGRGEVITIASTNRPDILDPALVRPGRFDRKIYIPKPGLIGREEILKVHARKKPMAPDVDYAVVASLTNGMVGAELVNIIEVAALFMMREGRTEITTDDLIQAAQMEESGPLQRKERSPETWKQIAISEAAAAVAAVNFPDLRNVEYITIAPRAGRELGYVRSKMDHVKFDEGMLSRQSLLDYITVQLAPRAADELWYGEGQLSTIWAEAADNARSAARALILGGLSEKYYGLNNFWVTDRLNDIDSEALRITTVCYERAKEILERNRRLMDAVVNQLVEKKSLTKQEFLSLVQLHGSIQPTPPSIVDLRLAKQLEFQNLLRDQKEASTEV